MGRDLGRNDPCSCGSGKKYKRCCLAPAIAPRPSLRRRLAAPPSLASLAGARGQQASPATIRQRNDAFVVALADALQLTKLTAPSWADAKRAITPQAVRKINEAILRIWPADTDITATLKRTDDRQVAFFSGDYRPQLLLNSVGRHLIYADRVALADPFKYPLGWRDEYSPLLHPEKHRTTTAKNVMVWFQLANLIGDDLVEVIRLPSDFDPYLSRANQEASEALVERHLALRESVERHVRFRVDEDNDDNREWMTLLQTDRRLAQMMREAKPDASEAEVTDFLEYIRRRREDHPFYLDGVRDEIVAETTGSTVYDSVQVGSLSGAYMLTDLEPRWRQFEYLQQEAQQPVDGRSRVARGLQRIKLPMAPQLNLQLAQRIRQENQLGRVRGLLDKLMREAGGDKPLSDEEAKAFEHELIDAIAEAKHEYDAIDRDLLKFTGGELAGLAGMYGLTGGALTVTLGAAAAAGALNLVGSAWSRRTFRAKYPAAMFMDVPLRGR